MTLLALDPGPLQTGWVCYANGAVVDCGVAENALVLKHVQSYREDQLALERIQGYGMVVGREVFETAEWVGRYWQAWSDPAEVILVYRREVKLHLCGSAKAKDANVWQALVDKFGPGKEKAVGRKASPGPLYGVNSHARAALALAVTVAETR